LLRDRRRTTGVARLPQSGPSNLYRRFTAAVRQNRRSAQLHDRDIRDKLQHSGPGRFPILHRANARLAWTAGAEAVSSAAPANGQFDA
jgi:hypothetical protein